MTISTATAAPNVPHHGSTRWRLVYSHFPAAGAVAASRRARLVVMAMDAGVETEVLSFGEAGALPSVPHWLTTVNPFVAAETILPSVNFTVSGLPS